MKTLVDIHHHVDTLPSLLQLRNKGQGHIFALNNHLAEDYKTILSVPLYAQPGQNYDSLIQMIKLLKRRVDQAGSQARLILSKSDLSADFKLGVLLHVESARLIRKPENQLLELFELGIRGIIPLHFVDNQFGASCDDPLRTARLKRSDSGLTERGYLLIELMNKLKMWVDVTHTTDQTGLDILTCANEVMASHIAIRDLVPLKRNKPISFFKLLAEKNGIFGILPWQHLVGSQQDSYQQHIQTAIESGLANSLCIGTDFGAPIKTHTSIKSLYDCAKMVEAFDQAQLIQSENALRFFERALPD